MSVEIQEVKSIRDLKKMIEFPNRLYKKNPYYVPRLHFDELNILRRDKNPAFDHCEAQYWLAYKDGKIAGRIAVIINNKYIEKWKNRYARFGWVDFIDDAEVSEALFKTAEAWAKEKGMTALHGPMGFTDLDNEGMLVEGFEELGTLATLYNYPYYPEHLKKLGYEKDVDWVEYEIDAPQIHNETVERVAHVTAKRNRLQLLEVKKAKQLRPYAPEIFDIIDETYADLFGVVPLTDKQIKSYTDQYFGFIRPEYCPVIVNEEGRLVGFGITMPSLSKALQKAGGRLFPFGFIHLLKALKKNDRVDLYLVGVRREYKNKGVNAMLIHAMSQTYKQQNVKKVESNPELETNTKVQGQWKYYNRRQHKRRRCFIKHQK